MATKYTTIQQHEPLRVPSGWGQQERAFIAQLEALFDDVYRRFNRIRMRDLSEPLQSTIQESADGSEDFNCSDECADCIEAGQDVAFCRR